MEKAFNPDLFVAKWYCSEVWSEDMPKFAADALEAGYDGPALRRLSGLTRPTSVEIGDLFQRALAEVGKVDILSQEQGVLLRSRMIAADIVEGRIDPFQGANILAGYARILNYQILAEFLELSEMPFWGDYAPTKKTIIESILDHARLLISNVPG